jgi:PAS domain S-box-containing protein
MGMSGYYDDNEFLRNGIYKSILNNIDFDVIIYDIDGKIIYCNKKALENLQLNETDVIGKSLHDVFETQSDEYYKRIQEVVQTGRPAKYEFFFTFNSTKKWYVTTFSPLFTDKDVIFAVQASSIEIDKKNGIEDKPKENEDELRQIFDYLHQVLYIYDTENHNFIYVNPSYERVWEMPVKKVLSDPYAYTTRVHPDDQELFWAACRREQEDGEYFDQEYRIVMEDGRVKWIWSRNFPVLGKNRTVGIAEDITEKMDTVEQQRKSEEKFRNIFNSSNNGIVIADVNGTILDINYEFVKIVSYTKKELLGMNVKDLTHPDDHKRESIVINKMLQKATADIKYRMDKRYITKNGDIKWVNLSVSPVKDSDGKPSFIIGTVIDITDTIRHQKNLKEREQKFRNLVEHSSDMLFFHDAEGKILEVNSEAVKHTGYSKKELLGMTVFDIDQDTEEKDDKIRYWKSLKVEDPPVIFDTRHKRKDGTIYDVEISVSKICLDDGEYVLGLARDITVRKKIEEDLKISEENYRTIFNNSTDAIFVHDYTTGKIIDVNKTTMDIFGYTKDEIKKLNVGDLSINQPPYTQQDAFEWIQKAANEGPQQFEWLAKNKSGHLVWFENILQLVTISGEKKVLVMGRNITEKKRVEKNLKESEAKYRAYIDNAPDGIFITDEQGKYVEVNKAATLITGYTKEELLKKTIADMAHPDCSHMALDTFQQLKLKGYADCECCFIHKDGTKRWWYVDAVRISAERYLGFSKDITEMVRVKEKIKEEQKKTEVILDATADGVRIVSKERRILALNKKMSEMTDIPQGQAIGMKCSEHIRSPHCGTDNCPLEIVMKTGKGFEQEETRVILSGERKPYLLSVVPYRNEKGSLIGIIEDYRDITLIKESQIKIKKAHDELKQLNQDLERKVDERTKEIQQVLRQKDEFIAQLGHDLKNPLGPLSQLLPILENKVNDPRQREILRVANRNVSYMKNLVVKTIQLAQLKSPSTVLHLERIDLYDEVNGIIDRNKMLFKEKNIKIENNIPESVSINVDRLQLNEVFCNLLNNSVKYTDKAKSIITIGHKEDEKSIILSIKDMGIGMTSEQLEKVFNEFYKADTSRHDFDSSGLGLPITKRIIEMHGGIIWAESEGLGKGSTFYFTLPIHMKNDFK